MLLLPTFCMYSTHRDAYILYVDFLSHSSPITPYCRDMCADATLACIFSQICHKEMFLYVSVRRMFEVKRKRTRTQNEAKAYGSCTQFLRVMRIMCDSLGVEGSKIRCPRARGMGFSHTYITVSSHSKSKLKDFMKPTYIVYRRSL